MRGRRVARQLLREPALVRLLAAYGLFCLCEYGIWIAVIVYAYGRGGPTAAGVVAAAQLAPAAVCAPMFAAASDRLSPGRILVGGYVAQAVGCAVMAVTAGLDGPPLVVYAGAVIASTFVAAIRPAQTAALPGLTRDVAGLTAANVAVSWLESVALCIAGLGVGVGIATVGIAWVFGVPVLLLLLAAVTVAPVRIPAVAAREDITGPWRDMRRAASAVAGNRAARLLVILLATEFVIVGALDVLFIVLAVGVLQVDTSWTGYLNTAYGVGGVLLGTLMATLLARRLGPVIAVAAGVVGAALAATSATDDVAPVVALLVVVGAGRAVYDVAARSLLQRVVPAQLVARVFGLAESVAMAGLAIGSLLTPLLVAAVGNRGAVVGVALLLPLVSGLTWRAVLRLDETANVPVVQIALLRSVPLFRDLPAPALEGIARALRREEVAAGTVVIAEGAAGDDFVVLSDGTLDVSQRGVPLRVLHRGDGAGEIALLRDVPRTASVVASSPVVLYRLSRAPFLTAVNAHVPTQRRGEQLARDLIG